MTPLAPGATLTPCIGCFCKALGDAKVAFFHLKCKPFHCNANPRPADPVPVQLKVFVRLGVPLKYKVL
jgi:hypothetical protein